MKTRLAGLGLLLGMAGVAAGGTVAAAERTDARAQSRGRLAGTVWMRTSPATPAGSFRIFLGEGTAVTGSCTETYRLDRWRMASASRLTLSEDGVTIPVQVAFTGGELRLRLRLRDGGTREERFRPARVPYLCPQR